MGVGLALAYFDIDNFKRDFNTPYTETAVDRDCLPVIMQAIEAHVFKHGSSIHEGGDEFVILMPNATKEYAIAFMDELRCKQPTLLFRNIKARVTISIGLCHVEADCFLTDLEIRMKANAAKKYAKEQGGKNCIATYAGEEYSESQLHKVRPKPEC
jgi:diguanylate cyclase (GGDEF)-like protein